MEPHKIDIKKKQLAALVCKKKVHLIHPDLSVGYIRVYEKVRVVSDCTNGAKTSHLTCVVVRDMYGKLALCNKDNFFRIALKGNLFSEVWKESMAETPNFEEIRLKDEHIAYGKIPKMKGGAICLLTFGEQEQKRIQCSVVRTRGKDIILHPWCAENTGADYP